MSTRKRPRPSLNANSDEDELSPSKPTPAPLVSVKKRKLNTYGKPKPAGFLGKLAGLIGYGQSGGEKENGVEVEKDELAVDEESEAENEVDIYEVPDDEDSNSQRRIMKGTPVSSKKETPILQRKSSAKSANRSGRKKDIYELDESLEDDAVVKSSARSQSIPQVSKSTNKKELEGSTPKPKRGRPRKHIEAEEPKVMPETTPRQTQLKRVAPSPKSTGRMRKSDILKKAKALSREAIFQQMAEAGRKAAAEESEDAQMSKRRRSDRTAQVDEITVTEEIEYSEPAKSARVKGKPNHDAVDTLREGPKGILTPTKDRVLKSKKSVAFEANNDLDLGFKDIPDSAKIAQKSGSKYKIQAQEHADQPISKPSVKKGKVSDPVEESAQSEEESEDEDETACAVCQGLQSKKGNEMILCENCDFAVHLKCYGLPKIPRGDWYCRDCQPDDDLLDPHRLDDVAVAEVFNDIPEIEGLEDHLRRMQRLLLDRLTGQKRIKLRGHDDEMRKVHQVVEQTVLAGEGNSMLVIGARGCGKTTVSFLY
jgi:origin recognition complex subunit 4